MTPELSVVIAAYNAADTLGAQLDALGRQTFHGTWEVLVCENGSTDETRQVAESYADTVPGLRVLDASATRGPGAARNVGAKAATAPLMMFCDADDVVADDWVEMMAEALQTATFVTGRPRRREFNARPDAEEYFSWGIYRVPYFPYLPGAGAGSMGIDRQAFLDAGGFDESLRTGEDLDLCWRMQLAGHRLVEEPRAVVTVSNRDGLGASIAQTFAYGVGDRRLKHKYALVEAAYLREGAVAQIEVPEASDAGDHPELSPTGLVGRVWRKLVSLRHPSDVTNVARKVSTWLGFRFGRIDRSAPQVVPPATLPREDPS